MLNTSARSPVLLPSLTNKYLKGDVKLMFEKVRYYFRALLFVLMILCQPFATAGVSAAPGSDFVKQAGPELRLHGKPFRFAGSNNYYLMYKSPFMVDEVLN